MRGTPSARDERHQESGEGTQGQHGLLIGPDILMGNAETGDEKIHVVNDNREENDGQQEIGRLKEEGFLEKSAQEGEHFPHALQALQSGFQDIQFG